MSLFGKLFKKSSKEPVIFEDERSEPVELKSIPFNLNDTLRDAANVLAYEAQSKNVSIIFRVKKNVPSKVIGDRYKLAKVLNEIIGNAIDFTDKSKDVIVQIERNEKNEESVELHFEVIDSGVGIDERAVEEILMPMLTSDKRARTFGIEGEGLERARDIIHAMRGSIQMKCHEKKGCRVSFFVQLGAKNLHEKRHYRLPSKAGVGLKSLVVDEDAGSAKALVPMLEYFRHKVTLGEIGDLHDVSGYDLVMVSSRYWSESLQKRFEELSPRPKIVMIESMIQHHHVEDRALEYVDWLIYKPFTQQFVYEMLVALYSDTLSHASENEEEISEGKELQLSASKSEKSESGIEIATSAVEAFLNGGNIDEGGSDDEGRCICCKYSHQFFVAADGLQWCNNDYAEFVERLKEAIWKFVKADKVVVGMVQKGELEKTAEYCAKMKVPLAELGIYKLACLCNLLESACQERHTKDIEMLSKSFGYVLSQTISALDQFIEQAKYKIRD